MHTIELTLNDVRAREYRYCYGLEIGLKKNGINNVYGPSVGVDVRKRVLATVVASGSSSIK